jgi:hypothetical protein
MKRLLKLLLPLILLTGCGLLHYRHEVALGTKNPSTLVITNIHIHVSTNAPVP